MPMLSIIVPIYNTEKYLKECMESLTHQTCKDIEIICVNDGSTDNSLNIIQEYANQDDRVKIINQTNQGQSAARNNGLKNAKGRYITFIDSDDYLDLNTYEVALSNIENVDIVCFGVKTFGSCSTKQKKSDDEYYEIKQEGLIELNDKIRFETDCSVCNKIFKREILDKYNIDFPQGMHYEDAEFYFKYINVITKAIFINKYFYHYRRRENSIMSNTFNGCEYAIDHLYIVKRLYEFLKINNLYEKREKLFAKIFTAYFKLAYYHSLEEKKTEIFELAKKYANKFSISNKNTNYTIKILKNGKISDLGKIQLNPLEKIFSVKNDLRGTHKILTILGVSLKIKRRKNA